MAKAQGSQTTAPKAEVKVVSDQPESVADKIVTKINVWVSKSGVSFSGKKVRVYIGTRKVEEFDLDANGEYEYNHTEPDTQAGKRIDLEFRVEGENEAGSIFLDLPAKVEKKKADKKNDDPERFFIHSHVDPVTWIPTIFARVLKSGGVGIKSKVVTVRFDNGLHEIVTNAQGHKDFTLPRVLKKGETLEIEATVSGIEKSNVLRLTRRRSKPKPPKRWSGKWWFRHNNGRAVMFLIISAVLLFSASFAGFGNAIFDQSTELSVQQKLFNASVEKVNQSKMIKPAGKKGDWPVNLWKVAITFSIFSIIYSVCSLREEIIDGTKEGIERLIKKSSDSASDPLVERLATMYGIYAQAHKKDPPLAKGPVENKTPTGKPSFFKLFETEMAAEVAMSVLAGIFNNIVRKK